MNDWTDERRCPPLLLQNYHVPPVKTQHESVVPWLLTSVPISSLQMSCQLYSHLDLSWLPPKSKATTKHLPPSDNLTWTWTCVPPPAHRLLERPATSSWNYLLLLDSFLNPWHPPTRALYREWWQGPPFPSLKLPFGCFLIWSLLLSRSSFSIVYILSFHDTMFSVRSLLLSGFSFLYWHFLISWCGCPFRTHAVTLFLTPFFFNAFLFPSSLFHVPYLFSFPLLVSSFWYPSSNRAVRLNKGSP